MGLKLSEKLELLGAAGRARLGRAWADPEVTIRIIEVRFGFGPPDIAELKALLGERRLKPARLSTWRGTDQRRQRKINAARRHMKTKHATEKA